jgi:hypothetical protein
MNNIMGPDFLNPFGNMDYKYAQDMEESYNMKESARF